MIINHIIDNIYKNWVAIKTTVSSIRPNEIYAVAVFNQGCEKTTAILKKIKKSSNKVILIPADHSHDIQVYHQSETQIVGKVVRVIRILK